MSGRALRVGFLTTLATNVGDDWIREGVRAVLDRAAPGYSPLLVNKWSQASLRDRAEDEREQVGDKYWESDVFIIAGAPVYWHLTGGRHRSLEAEWHKWIYADRALSGGDREHPVLLNLGAGSGQPWGDDGSCFVNDAECAAFARELGWQAAVTTVRDRVADSILERLEVPHRLLPCPAFLAPRRRDPISGAGGPIGVNLMHLGGHFALDGEFSTSRWREQCGALLEGLRKLGRVAFICHDSGEQRFMESLAAQGEELFSSPDWREYHAAYARCGAVVANRVHGAVYAAGCGVPSVIIGNDSRALIGEPIQLPVERSATLDPAALVERVRGMLQRRSDESAALLERSDRTLELYTDVVRPIVSAITTDRPRSSQPAQPTPAEQSLAFITGCGRSGTTILGRILEHHGQVRYFNDRFDLWARPFPFTDIWGYHHPSATSMPRVALDEEDARVPQASLEWFIGLMERERGDRPVLVEKLAINNFRLRFITALRPEARLINIVRHGVEVAHSIAAKIDAGQWYGEGDRKWNLLVEYAWAHGYGDLLRWCTSPYHKGLLEWRMSVDAADKFFESGPSSPALRLRYEELLANPAAVCGRLREFLGLAASEGMLKFAMKEVGRRSPAAADRPSPKGTREIAGEALKRLGYEP